MTPSFTGLRDSVTLLHLVDIRKLEKMAKILSYILLLSPAVITGCLSHLVSLISHPKKKSFLFFLILRTSPGRVGVSTHLPPTQSLFHLKFLGAEKSADTVVCKSVGSIYTTHILVFDKWTHVLC